MPRKILRKPVSYQDAVELCKELREAIQIYRETRTLPPGCTYVELNQHLLKTSRGLNIRKSLDAKRNAQSE